MDFWFGFSFSHLFVKKKKITGKKIKAPFFSKKKNNEFSLNVKVERVVRTKKQAKIQNSSIFILIFSIFISCAPFVKHFHVILVFRNIVATVNLDCRLDLKTIALHARNAEYNPKVLPHSMR